MLAALVTTDSRAGPRAEQLAAIGGEPDRVYVVEDVRDYLSEILRNDQEDVIAVSHPRAFGDKRAATALLRSLIEAAPEIQVGESRRFPMSSEADLSAFLVFHGATSWGKGTKKQKGRGRGAPKKYNLTEDQEFAILREYWNPRNKDNPDGCSIQQVLQTARDFVGPGISESHVKYWAFQKVGHRSRKGVDWRDVFPDRVARVTAKPKGR